MKFLTVKGKIEEGTPLTDEQVLQRTNLIEYFHETACEGAYHGTYGWRPCENLANAFVTGAIAESTLKTWRSSLILQPANFRSMSRASR
jgi:hypothetical protein